METSDERKRGLQALWHHHPFHIHIAALFSAMMFIASTAIVWVNYEQGRAIVLDAAENLFDRIHRETGDQISALRAPIEAIVSLMSGTTITDAESFESRMQTLPALTDMLDRDNRLAALYVGYQNGDFFLVRALRGEPALRAQLHAPRHAQYVLQSVELRLSPTPRWLLLDAALNVISELPAPAYDPRSRPWYKDAEQSQDVIVTAPYVFSGTGAVGITVARRAEHGRAVVGADIRLDRISELLQQIRVTPSTQLALYDGEGHVIAQSDPTRVTATGRDGVPVLAQVADLSPVLASGTTHAPQYARSAVLKSAGREWMMKVAPLESRAAAPYQLALAAPLDELLAEARQRLLQNLLIAMIIITVSLPLLWWVAGRIAANLKDLTKQAAAIRNLDFSDQPLPRTRINEVHGLSRAMGEMRTTIRKFLDLSTALASERNFDVLLHRVLREADVAADAKSGVIYLLENDGDTLKPAAQMWESGMVGEALPSLSLSDHGHTVTAALTHAAPAAIYELNTPRPAGMEYLATHFEDNPLHMIAVQLRNRAGGIVGVMCLFIPASQRRPSAERLALVEAFAGAGAVAIDNQRLLLTQKALLQAFIGLVASAIDAKSPYTGGHCQRVPEITKMLARAACDTKEGPYADFTIDDDGWEALHIASWLHDCGKVTTPEYVVDKATKLETIYDRIHEIRTRFEVLKRDAEIACLTGIIKGGDEAALRANLVEQQRTLDEEFAFVASCNEGGEFMAPERIEKLQRIAARTWQRTLDDRLGVSWEEAARMASVAATPLPATEHLLADKAAHIIKRDLMDMIAEDNPWGFKIRVPAHRYNRGEIYNLSIARGTLTEEERYKVNDHIVQTIIMLSQLPFPGHLGAVPELAGGHHEKMDGTGYPKRLTRDNMSVQARIMAIADIFEALTACDRPYKKGKKLSEAIRIMALMKKDNHVDPDLFDLFLTSGVYQAYADRFLKPEYIDEVDISAYVAPR